MSPIIPLAVGFLVVLVDILFSKHRLMSPIIPLAVGFSVALAYILAAKYRHR